MRIGCVTRAQYPTDQEVRVTKFAATLSSAGHAFFVFCPEREAQDSAEQFEYGQIIRLGSRRLGAIGKLLLAPVPINPLWILWLRRQFRLNSLDLVIVRDLRLAIPTFIAARTCGIKAILDLGEHYPGMVQVLGKQSLIHVITRNQWLIKSLEAISVRMADLVWVVVEENKARLLRHNERIEVVNNYPLLYDQGRNSVGQPAEHLASPSEPVTLTSLGIIDNIRGLDLAIDALAILVRGHEAVRLVIYGDGEFRPKLEKRVGELGLDEYVVFGGWVSEERKYEALATGDIGLLLHRVCDLTQHTLPNKLFDYMSVGLPVVSTPMKPVIRILEAEQCGVWADEDAESIADIIRSLLTDSNERQRLGENGYKAMMYYKWDGELVAQSVVKLASH